MIRILNEPIIRVVLAAAGFLWVAESPTHGNHRLSAPIQAVADQPGGPPNKPINSPQEPPLGGGTTQAVPDQHEAADSPTNPDGKDRKDREPSPAHDAPRLLAVKPDRSDSHFAADRRAEYRPDVPALLEDRCAVHSAFAPADCSSLASFSYVTVARRFTFLSPLQPQPPPVS